MLRVILWGIGAEGHGQRARLCCRLISNSIFWLFCFTPTLASRCNALPKKVPKRIIQKKRQQQIRDGGRFFYTFPLFTGFNNHSMVEGVFPEYIEMVESPS